MVWNWRKLRPEVKSLYGEAGQRYHNRWNEISFTFVCLCLCHCGSGPACQKCKCVHVRLSDWTGFTRFDRCLCVFFPKIEVRQTDGCSGGMRRREWEGKWGRGSQGQRVIRLFSVRPGKLSSLGDEKWLYGSMRVIEFCCRAKRKDGTEKGGKKADMI